MIVLFQNNKIVAIDKKLLQILNTSLENLDKVLSTLKLSITALTNENLIIENKTFKVEEIELLSIENIKAYKLE